MTTTPGDKCRGDLDPHPVARIVEAALALLVAQVEPSWTDHSQHHLAGLKALLQDGRKGLPGRNRSMSRNTLRLPNAASRYWATFKAWDALSSRR